MPSFPLRLYRTGMNRAIALRYAAETLPRYTSYPTAADFSPAVGAEDLARWLGEADPASTLSLYVHIPFCQTLCWYCGCHTSVPNGYGRAEAYGARLLEEIDLVARHVGAHAGVVHVHLGGGTPTYLSPDDLRLLMSRLYRRFPLRAGAEIAVEIDPRGLDEARAEALAECGTTRASLGIQDFDPGVQRLINRVQPRETVDAAIAKLKAVGISGLSFDLVYGLPGQSVASVVASAREAAALRPSRLAVFGYAHVPWFKKHQRAIDETRLPDMAARLDMAEAIDEVLQGAGYEAIGFDHYARPEDSLAKAAASGRLHRNFQGYTDDPADMLIGFGASAIGALPQGFVQNETDLGRWRQAIREGRLPVARGLALTPEDRLRGEAIERLMCDLELDFGALCLRHGRNEDALDDALPRLAALALDGLVHLAGRTVTVGQQGRRFLRTVSSAFDLRSRLDATRHSRAV